MTSIVISSPSHSENAASQTRGETSLTPISTEKLNAVNGRRAALSAAISDVHHPEAGSPACTSRTGGTASGRDGATSSSTISRPWSTLRACSAWPTDLTRNAYARRAPANAPSSKRNRMSSSKPRSIPRRSTGSLGSKT